MILQWGRNTDTASNSNYTKTITLPTAFSSQNYSVLVTDIIGNGTATAMTSIESTTQFKKYYTGYGNNNIKGFYYIAIGY